MPEYKENGISIMAKTIEEECPYISISGSSCYRRHKTRALLIHNQGRPLFADGNKPNAIITFNFWQEHDLIIVDPDRPRHFRLDMIKQ